MFSKKAAIMLFMVFKSDCGANFFDDIPLIDDVVADTLEEWGGIGLTAWSVDSQGRMCSLGTVGERIKGSGEELQTTGDSRHHIGSVSKSMTSSLLAILIDDGMIPNGWDATLKEILPDAQENNYSNATLRQVVGMISGISNDIDDDLLPEYDPEDVRSIRRAVTIGALRSTPLFPPGTGYQYTNAAYIVAGHIIEELTGQTWEEALSHRLFAPLGIDLGDDPSDFTGAPNNLLDPWGHSSGSLVPCDPSIYLCDNPKELGPAGTFSGPVAAMARYFAWHIQCHKGTIPEEDSSASLLSQESCQEIHQPADPTVSGYGFGWICYNHTQAGGLVCTHNGSNTWNYYNVTLAFGMDRAFSGYTNGFRPEWEDALMVNEVVSSVLFGENKTDCRERIPSTIYMNSSSDNSRTSEPSASPSLDDSSSGSAPSPTSMPTNSPVDNTSGSISSKAQLIFLFMVCAVSFSFI